MSGGRLIAVFGYSDRTTDALHPICAARLERAMRESQAGDVVLLSGWARWRKPISEAELMACAWNGDVRHVSCSTGMPARRSGTHAGPRTRSATSACAKWSWSRRAGTFAARPRSSVQRFGASMRK